MYPLPDLFPADKKPLLMGIVNSTGDSFSEGGLSSPESALKRAFLLLEEGADILDMGGESTRPGAPEITPEEEIRRLLPVVTGVLEKKPETVISIDTRHARTAEEMLAAGARIINDVSMLRHDPEMVDVLNKFPESILVLCHSRGVPENMQEPRFLDYGTDIVKTVSAELLAAAEASGLRKERIIFDPGFGFSKTFEQNMILMRKADQLVRRLGPVLFGISRKSFVGMVTREAEPAERVGGTVAGELHLCRSGGVVIRTHNVKVLRAALLMQQALQENGEVFP